MSISTNIPVLLITYEQCYSNNVICYSLPVTIVCIDYVHTQQNWMHILILDTLKIMWMENNCHIFVNTLLGFSFGDLMKHYLLSNICRALWLKSFFTVVGLNGLSELHALFFLSATVCGMKMSPGQEVRSRTVKRRAPLTSHPSVSTAAPRSGGRAPASRSDLKQVRFCLIKLLGQYVSSQGFLTRHFHVSLKMT